MKVERREAIVSRLRGQIDEPDSFALATGLRKSITTLSASNTAHREANRTTKRVSASCESSLRQSENFPKESSQFHVYSIPSSRSSIVVLQSPRIVSIPSPLVSASIRATVPFFHVSVEFAFSSFHDHSPEFFLFHVFIAVVVEVFFHLKVSFVLPCYVAAEIWFVLELER